MLEVLQIVLLEEDRTSTLGTIILHQFRANYYCGLVWVLTGADTHVWRQMLVCGESLRTKVRLSRVPPNGPF